jgi:hypothetical protein
MSVQTAVIDLQLSHVSGQSQLVRWQMPASITCGKNMGMRNFSKSAPTKSSEDKVEAKVLCRLTFDMDDALN